MPTPRRVLGTAAGLALAASALTSCQKPVPELTVLSGSATTQVSPQTYCFDTAHCRFPKSDVRRVSARPGSTLLIDVPRSVAAESWNAVSAVQKSNGTFATIKGANYQSGTVRDSHSARVDVPYGVGSYYLVVRQLSGTTNGSWIAEITITR
jgi:hypothetical protein